MKNLKLAKVVGVVLVIVAVIIGLIPISYQGVSCGSVLIPSDAAEVHDLTTSFSNVRTDFAGQCDQSRTLYFLFFLISLAVGSLLFIWAWYTTKLLRLQSSKAADEAGNSLTEEPNDNNGRSGFAGE
ncbi:hypothetical protein BK816_08480 [Boudabousia tangfeifanii]|uniref:Uncharacterized protein n=1 Tax=Boudabousia tangfeifanii TaxID=1912795 RepID=A0A1D9MM39_9ACTO|nr:hypothetical protein [Boudabousia tangfeifanii]AOZ73308.1 hypothetical protein BK816_08480 [Boudabousia tangfeifanii]